MAKPGSTLPFAPGFEDLPDVAKQSLANMSGMFSTWLRDASRVQNEAIRFLNERFNKDVELISQFSQCKRPEDVLALQTKLVSELISDYMNESKTMFSLLGEASKHNLDFAQQAATMPSDK